jgi:hypothetical protein
MVVVLEMCDILHIAGPYKTVDAMLELLAVKAAVVNISVRAVCTMCIRSSTSAHTSSN